MRGRGLLLSGVLLVVLAAPADAAIAQRSDEKLAHELLPPSGGDWTVSCGGTAPAEARCSTSFVLDADGLSWFGIGTGSPFLGNVTARATSGTASSSFSCETVAVPFVIGGSSCRGSESGKFVRGQTVTLTGEASAVGQWRVFACAQESGCE
jgi:hypothetical protein